MPVVVPGEGLCRGMDADLSQEASEKQVKQ